jgi:hypothetical protein
VIHREITSSLLSDRDLADRDLTVAFQRELGDMGAGADTYALPPVTAENRCPK